MKSFLLKLLLIISVSAGLAGVLVLYPKVPNVYHPSHLSEEYQP